MVFFHPRAQLHFSLQIKSVFGREALSSKTERTRKKFMVRLYRSTGPTEGSTIPISKFPVMFHETSASSTEASTISVDDSATSTKNKLKKDPACLGRAWVPFPSTRKQPRKHDSASNTFEASATSTKIKVKYPLHASVAWVPPPLPKWHKQRVGGEHAPTRIRPAGD